MGWLLLPKTVFIGSTAARLFVVARAATNDAPGACLRTRGVDLRLVGVVGKPVLAPLPHVAAHVIDAQLVRLQTAHGARLLSLFRPPGVAAAPSHLIGIVAAAVQVALRLVAATGGKLPLGLGGQTELQPGELVETLNESLRRIPVDVVDGPIHHVIFRLGAAHHRVPQLARDLGGRDEPITACHSWRVTSVVEMK